MLSEWSFQRYFVTKLDYKNVYYVSYAKFNKKMTP